MIELENGQTLYFAGDTCVFGDMQLIGRIYSPDIAVLPIGGHFTMDPREAAVACELLGVKRVVPCHYGTFPLLKGTPDAPVISARVPAAIGLLWQLVTGDNLPTPDFCTPKSSPADRIRRWGG